jgi:hypothetical protein
MISAHLADAGLTEDPYGPIDGASLAALRCRRTRIRNEANYRDAVAPTTRETHMLLADIGSGDLFWGIVEFFFLFILIMIVFQVIGDLFRDHSMSGGVKALWVVFLIVLPPVAILVYLIARGPGMQQRAIERQDAVNAQLAQYAQRSIVATDPAEQIANAKALLDGGTINADEFDQLKQKALA